MSVHISYGRGSLGFDQCEWLMLLLTIAVLGAIVSWGETLRPIPIATFADNIVDNPCGDIFVENASCMKFLIRGSLSFERSDD